jgi:DNA-binding transcriptional LysR family regulator
MLQGHGLAVLPRYFVAADLKAGRLKRIMSKVPMRRDQFRLVWRRDHPKAQALQLLGMELRKLPLR